MDSCSHGIQDCGQAMFSLRRARFLPVTAKFLVFAGFDDVQNGAEQQLGFFGLGPTGIVPVVLHQDLVAG